MANIIVTAAPGAYLPYGSDPQLNLFNISGSGIGITAEQSAYDTGDLRYVMYALLSQLERAWNRPSTPPSSFGPEVPYYLPPPDGMEITARRQAGAQYVTQTDQLSTHDVVTSQLVQQFIFTFKLSAQGVIDTYTFPPVTQPTT